MLFGPQVFEIFYALCDRLARSPMLANPLVRFLERKLCLVRKHSSMAIVAGVLALVIGLIYLAVSNGARLLWSFMKDLPDLYAGIRSGSSGKPDPFGKPVYLCTCRHQDRLGKTGK